MSSVGSWIKSGFFIVIVFALRTLAVIRPEKENAMWLKKFFTSEPFSKRAPLKTALNRADAAAGKKKMLSARAAVVISLVPFGSQRETGRLPGEAPSICASVPSLPADPLLSDRGHIGPYQYYSNLRWAVGEEKKKNLNTRLALRSVKYAPKRPELWIISSFFFSLSTSPCSRSRPEWRRQSSKTRFQPLASQEVLK